MGHTQKKTGRTSARPGEPGFRTRHRDSCTGQQFMTLHQEKCLFKKKSAFPGLGRGSWYIFLFGDMCVCVCVRHKYVLYYVLFIFISINSIYSFILRACICLWVRVTYLTLDASTKSWILPTKSTKRTTHILANRWSSTEFHLQHAAQQTPVETQSGIHLGPGFIANYQPHPAKKACQISE